jgi:hypothetical protein
VAHFLDAKNTPRKHHDLPATHHNFTTKNHTKSTPSPQNPLQKHPSHHTKKNTARQKAGPHFNPTINSPYTPA